MADSVAGPGPERGSHQLISGWEKLLPVLLQVGNTWGQPVLPPQPTGRRDGTAPQGGTAGGAGGCEGISDTQTVCLQQKTFCSIILIPPHGAAVPAQPVPRLGSPGGLGEPWGEQPTLQPPAHPGLDTAGRVRAGTEGSLSPQGRAGWPGWGGSGGWMGHEHQDRAGAQAECSTPQQHLRGHRLLPTPGH